MNGAHPVGRCSALVACVLACSGAARAPQGVIPDHALNGVTEWAYGVRDWLEAATYLPLYTRSADGRLFCMYVKSGMMRSTPSSSGSGNITPASTTIVVSAQVSASMFMPNSPSPPRDTTSSIGTVGASTSRTRSLAEPVREGSR